MYGATPTLPELPACSIPYVVDAGGVPVFSPTPAQFDDFHSFIHAVYAVGSASGIIRVVPPTSYVPNASQYGDVGSDLQVHTPVYQQVQGAAGVYQMLPIERDSMTVRQFAHECMKVERARSAREKAMAADSDYAALEAAYWKNIGHSQPCYGADSPGSLFDTGAPWNMDRLQTLLDLVPGDIGGVTRPMLYFGQWKASFCVHVEDMNLSSINFIHAGHPKQWYALAPHDHSKFEQLASQLYAPLQSKCREFLRHKHVLLKPSKLRERGLCVRQTVQREGEFVVTWPCSYHQGYNLGFNVAESVNFATEQWVEWGEQADVCQCRAHSVRIDVAEFRRKVERVNAVRAEMEGEQSGEQSAQPLSMAMIRADPRLMEALMAAGHNSVVMASGQRTMAGVELSIPAPVSPTESTASFASSSTASSSSLPSLSASNPPAAAEIPPELLEDAFDGGEDDEDEDGVTYQEDWIPEAGVNLQLQCGYAQCEGRTFRNVATLQKHWQSHKADSSTTASKPAAGRRSRTSGGEKRRRRDEDEEFEVEDDGQDGAFRSGGGGRATAHRTRTRRAQRGAEYEEDVEAAEADDEQLSMLELLALRRDKLGLSARWTAAMKQAKQAARTSKPLAAPEQRENEQAEQQPADRRDETHDVEAIVKHRRVQGVVQFWIKWQGHAEHTWEPLEHVEHLLDEMYPKYRIATPKRKR